jgi:hypothetical protein
MGTLVPVREPGRSSPGSSDRRARDASRHLPPSEFIPINSRGFIAGWRPAAAYLYLDDSNIDWGQDLPGLAAWQSEMGLCRSRLGTSAPIIRKRD